MDGSVNGERINAPIPIFIPRGTIPKPHFVKTIPTIEVRAGPTVPVYKPLLISPLYNLKRRPFVKDIHFH
jgi:hypothetical protein